VGLASTGFIVGAAVVIWAMGRDLICPCGTVKFWFGDRVSPENSQHLFDWWTFTHLAGGPVFYFLAWVVARRWFSIEGVMLTAITIVVGWEIIENTDYIIDRYRGAGAWDYYGDSVVNAVGDLLVGIAGIVLAVRLPTSIVVAGVIGIEMAGALIIRDGLFLNFLMLIHPIDAIQNWQAGVEGG
jgi:hypothetical protein